MSGDETKALDNILCTYIDLFSRAFYIIYLVWTGGICDFTGEVKYIFNTFPQSE